MWWWQISAYQGVCMSRWAEEHEGWVWSCRSQYAQLSVCEWLWHTASPSSEEYSFPCISHPLCLSGSLSLSPPLPSLPLPASHSLHLFSPTFSFSPFPALYLVLTLISPPHFSLFHSFSVNTEECSMWPAVALWLLILATLLRGEWLSSVLGVRLCSNKCVFSACAVYCMPRSCIVLCVW